MVKTLELAMSKAATLPEAAQEQLGRELLDHIETLTELRAEIEIGIKELDAGKGEELDIEELIRDGIDGWVVERGDIRGAVERTCEALAGRDRSAVMVAAANAHLREEFDLDDSMRRYADRWRELAGLKREDEPPHRRVQRPLTSATEIERAVLR